ncbi:hypothetical protein [Verminephrobacter aporrectodeae]|uniref:hypothetical protein n=1 Tax=Verminephrobacter aporrectodeae TaxID=1110389 RepID=UPI0038B3DFCA
MPQCPPITPARLTVSNLGASFPTGDGLVRSVADVSFSTALVGESGGPTWSSMVAGSQQYAHQAYQTFWVVLFPGLAIIFSALALQLLGDGVRDLLDPRLQKAA